MRLAKCGWMTFLVLLCGSTVAHAETTLFDFYAAWCVPCQAMAPAVDALARDGYVVERVNVDQDRELAAKFGVTAIPCFVVVERGKEVDRIVGHIRSDEAMVGKLGDVAKKVATYYAQNDPTKAAELRTILATPSAAASTVLNI